MPECVQQYRVLFFPHLIIGDIVSTRYFFYFIGRFCWSTRGSLLQNKYVRWILIELFYDKILLESLFHFLNIPYIKNSAGRHDVENLNNNDQFFLI